MVGIIKLDIKVLLLYPFFIVYTPSDVENTNVINPFIPFIIIIKNIINIMHILFKICSFFLFINFVAFFASNIVDIPPIAADKIIMIVPKKSVSSP